MRIGAPLGLTTLSLAQLSNRHNGYDCYNCASEFKGMQNVIAATCNYSHFGYLAATVLHPGRLATPYGMLRRLLILTSWRTPPWMFVSLVPIRAKLLNRRFGPGGSRNSGPIRHLCPFLGNNNLGFLCGIFWQLEHNGKREKKAIIRGLLSGASDLCHLARSNASIFGAVFALFRRILNNSEVSFAGQSSMLIPSSP